MSIFELFLTACGLSMDAFAVSVTNGLCVRKGRVRGALMCGIIFGLFQGIMPAIGYALGMNFAEYIERFDHWIALILLGFIGLNMICGSGEDEIQTGGKLTFGAVLVQGFATSVDALAGHKLCCTWCGHSQVGGVYMCCYGDLIVLWVYAW